MPKGFIHIYTGNGKGKTTAAFGLAVRALCAGKNVYVGQFVKSMKYNETRIAEIFDGTNPKFGKICIEQLGGGCFIDTKPTEADIALAAEGLRHCAEIMASGEYDVVIFDELTIALHFGLIATDEVIEVLNRRNPSTEVVITGRYAPQELIDIADLVTDMQEVRHYYTQGILSRNGIDH